MEANVDPALCSTHVNRSLTEVQGQYPMFAQSLLWPGIVKMVGQMFPLLLVKIRNLQGNLRNVFKASDRLVNSRGWNSVWDAFRDYIQAIFLIQMGEQATTDANTPDPVLAEFNRMIGLGVEIAPEAEFSLIMVPKLFTVSQFSDAELTPLTLSNNYSVAKAVVAIIQVVYGTTELYQSSLRQLPRFGYASCSLTVVPYLMMSLVNLAATACEPQYPTLFLVRYGGSLTAEHEVPPGAGVVPDIEAPLESAPEYRNPEELVPCAVGEAFGSRSQDSAGNTPFDVCPRFVICTASH